MWHALAFTIAQKTPPEPSASIFVLAGILVVVVGFVLFRERKRSQKSEIERLSLTGTGKKIT